jgi:hypothetical protein
MSSRQVGPSIRIALSCSGCQHARRDTHDYWCDHPLGRGRGDRRRDDGMPQWCPEWTSADIHLLAKELVKERKRQEG